MVILLPRPIPAVAWLVLASLSAAPVTADAAGNVPPARPRPGEVALYELASVRRQFHAWSRSLDAATWRDLTRLVEALAGKAVVVPFTPDDLGAAATGAPGPVLVITPGLAARDAAAYQLLALGYSARETADIVSGRVTRRALDSERRLAASGRMPAEPRGLDSDRLAIEMRASGATAPAAVARGVAAATAPGETVAPSAPVPFGALIAHYANVHGVDPALVRAMIEAESNFNQAARSPAGAIGLMQLMPGTARELGVNPYVAEQNIEGGVRYFSQLQRMFGAVETALVAYNAGPAFARRYADGDVALYGETSAYVAKVTRLVESAWLPK